MKYLPVAAALLAFSNNTADPRVPPPGFFDKPFLGELILTDHGTDYGGDGRLLFRVWWQGPLPFRGLREKI